MVKKKLGRGFDALMPQNIDKAILEEDKNRVQKVLITDIKPNPEQPRKEFDQALINELAESVKRHGVLQPLIVVRHMGGYKIIAGERRWRAAQAAKLSHVPAIVRSLEELEQVELALIENIQRVDLSPFEQAMSVYRLQHQFNLTLEQIAKRLGKAHSTVSNITRLLQLPENAMDALRTNKISEGHARAILSLKSDKDAQDKLLMFIINNKWSVRQAESFVNDYKKGRLDDKMSASLVDAPIVQRISQKTKTKVQIKRKKNGGQIIIPFKSDVHLNKIADLFE